MLRIGIDIGGTFTDFAAWRLAPDGQSMVSSLKVPSTPPDYAEGFRIGFEEMLARLPPDPGELVLVMHGTTVSTNQVIERSGPAIGLLVTKGFRDLLELQRLRLRNPMDMFETRIKPLIPRQHVFEIEERLQSDGSARIPIDLDSVRRAADAARQAGMTGIAVAFHHSYRNPAHERAARDALAVALPGLHVSLSSDVWPRIGEYERAVVCVLNAYVQHRMNGYLAEVEAYLSERLPNHRLFITRSNGGAMAAREARIHPVHTLLSGPASGVTAAQFLGRAQPEAKLLTMDMGGTSTDLSLIRDGQPTISTEAEVGDFPLMMPVTGIEAIGAGGGSIGWMDGRVLRVGPQSAGARPGPACFGRGGTAPTLTDAYLLCGYLDPETFLGGRMSLDRAAAAAAMRPIAEALAVHVAAAAQACVAVATSNMVASVLPYLARHGVDPEDVTLVLYGGAGALHGPLLAQEIGIPRILVPTLPSVFCAFGGLVSELVHDTILTVHGHAMTPRYLRDSFAMLAQAAELWLAAQVPGDLLVGTRLEYWAEMRYRGQSFQINVALPATAVADGDLAAIEAVFHAENDRLYQQSNTAAQVEFIELRVRILGGLPTPPAETARQPAVRTKPEPTAIRPLRFGGTAAQDAPVLARARMAPGQQVAGPAIIEQSDATILVPPGYRAIVEPTGDIVLTGEI
jgi:N-methylhydantoinase A